MSVESKYQLGEDNYSTPKELYNKLNEEFHFDFDPNPINPPGLREFDGLGSWGENLSLLIHLTLRLRSGLNEP